MTAQTKGVDVLAVWDAARAIIETSAPAHMQLQPGVALEARAAIAELIEAVKTQRTIAEDSGPWNWPGACQTYAVLVGLPACPCPSRAAITKQADDNVAAALARCGSQP